jgi:hypothetical protein
MPDCLAPADNRWPEREIRLHMNPAFHRSRRTEYSRLFPFDLLLGFLAANFLRKAFLPEGLSDMRFKLMVKRCVSFVSDCCHIDLSGADCGRIC